MGDVINLNKARKARDKDARKAGAATNRAKFGKAKGETAAIKAESDKLRRALDEARRETKPGSEPADD
jgi:hypothetical protein